MLAQEPWFHPTALAGISSLHTDSISCLNPYEKPKPRKHGWAHPWFCQQLPQLSPQSKALAQPNFIRNTITLHLIISSTREHLREPGWKQQSSESGLLRASAVLRGGLPSLALDCKEIQAEEGLTPLVWHRSTEPEPNSQPPCFYSCWGSCSFTSRC